MMGLVFNFAVSAAMIFSAEAGDGGQVANASKQTRNNGDFIAKHYPPKALKRGEQGRVGFTLTVGKDGSLEACQVTKSSGFATLDSETCDLLIVYAHVDPVVDSKGNRVRASKAGYINWVLPSQQVALATPSATMLPNPEPLVCRRTPLSGSIIKKIKRCMTPSEWKIQEQRTTQALDQAVGPIRCSDHGC